MFIETREDDFTVIKEDYSRWMLQDSGVIIKAKVVLRKILLSAALTPEGLPTQMQLDTINSVTAMVPDNLKRKPTDPVTPNDVGEEVKFEEQKISLQEYMTVKGFRVTIKPVVTKILKYDKFNGFGEPIYRVIVQNITNIEKLSGTN